MTNFDNAVNDLLYGQVHIDEPVLFELMGSAAMMRLRGVLQHGITGLIGITERTTRFDHSVGTMLLVRRLGGSLEEQIAALLHDVSHTAFSHVIDYVFHGHDKQDYHDAEKEDYVSSTDLPAILANRGYDWRHVVDERRYPLLEQPAPALCADRLDYFLRDGLGLALATAEEIAWALSHLVVTDSRIVVDDLDVARWLGYTYIAADRASWANFREVALYELTAMAIRRGLEIGILSERDFWGTDEELWATLWSSDDTSLREFLGYISPSTEFVWDEVNPDFSVSTKLRTIDPEIYSHSRLSKLSSVDSEFAETRSKYLHTNRGKWPIRIVPG